MDDLSLYYFVEVAFCLAAVILCWM